MLQPLKIVFNGTTVILHLLAYDTSQVKYIVEIWIAFDAGSGILFGTFQVIEAELCYCAVIVWIGPIGLELYDLIEVLNGEYIIFKLQGVATYIHNALGVDLRYRRGSRKATRNT